MAENDFPSGANRDPNRIDVSLNVISDAALQAVNKLTSELSALREFVATQGNPDAASRAAGMARAAERVRAASEGTGISHGISPGAMPTGVGPDTPDAAAGQSEGTLREAFVNYNQNPTPEAWRPEFGRFASGMSTFERYRLARSEVENGVVGSSIPGTPQPTPGAGRSGQIFDRFFQHYHGTVQGQEDQTEAYLSGQGALAGRPSIPRAGDFTIQDQLGMLSGGRVGTPMQGRGAPSSPMADYGDTPAWFDALQGQGFSPDQRVGFTIPRLGEFTIQDKLGMAAQYLGQRAMSNQLEGQTGGMTTLQGRTANALGYARDQSASLVAIQREFQRMGEYTRGVAGGAEEQGFDRGGTSLSILGAGIRLPFSNLPGVGGEAAQEGWRQELTRRRVQAAPGVSGDEAERIMNVTRGMGYSGDINESLQYDVFRPLQQRGVAPEQAAPLIDQGIRQGNSSLSDMRETIINLADAARHANMNLQDVYEGTMQYAESVQNVGANYQEALRNAQVFTNSGIDPRIVSQSMQAPMTQGILAARYGLPANLQGTLGASAQAGGMTEAIRRGLMIAQPYAQRGDQYETTASGERILVNKSQDVQDAMAAQLAGVSPQIVARYRRNPNFMTTGTVAQDMLSRFGETARQGTEGTRRVPTYGEETINVGKFGTRQIRRQVGTHLEHYQKDMSQQARASLENTVKGDNKIQWGEIEQQLIAVDPRNQDWRNKVQGLRKTGDLNDRVRKAEQMVGNVLQPKPASDHLLDLTDDAKKLVKVIPNPKTSRSNPQVVANAGGPNVSASRLGPNYTGGP